MSQLITYGNFKAKILRDYDLEQEQFITPTELIGMTNSAIDDAEAIIHGLYEDYFIKSATVAVVAAQQDYDMPSDIYGDKIRHILFEQSPGGTNRYIIHREKTFVRTLDVVAEDPLRYIIINDSASYKKMRFFPVPSAPTNIGTLIIYYLRNANRIDDTLSQAAIDATIMDIPEFQNFLYAHVKFQIAMKEKLPQDMQVAAQILESQKQLMEDTLSARTPDEDTLIQQDLSAYYDFYINDNLTYQR